MGPVVLPRLGSRLAGGAGEPPVQSSGALCSLALLEVGGPVGAALVALGAPLLEGVVGSTSFSSAPGVEDWELGLLASKGGSARVPWFPMGRAAGSASASPPSIGAANRLTLRRGSLGHGAAARCPGLGQAARLPMVAGEGKALVVYCGRLGWFGHAVMGGGGHHGRAEAAGEAMGWGERRLG